MSRFTNKTSLFSVTQTHRIGLAERVTLISSTYAILAKREEACEKGLRRVRKTRRHGTFSRSLHSHETTAKVARRAIKNFKVKKAKRRARRMNRAILKTERAFTLYERERERGGGTCRSSCQGIFDQSRSSSTLPAYTHGVSRVYRNFAFNQTDKPATRSADLVRVLEDLAKRYANSARARSFRGQALDLVAWCDIKGESCL